MAKRWDVFVYGDVNIDLAVPGAEAFPPPGGEVDVDGMETFVGGGAALFALGAARLGLAAVFQGSVGRDMYGGYYPPRVPGNGRGRRAPCRQRREKDGHHHMLHQ